MERDMKKQLHYEYINNKVNPIFERLIVDLLIHKPDEIEKFMIKWLQNHIDSVPQTSEKSSPVKKIKKIENEEKPDSESEDDEHEIVEELPIKRETVGRARSSVSAEVYGQFNRKESYVPKIISKTKDQKERIIKRLSQAFMFSALDDKEKEIVVNAMEEKNFVPGSFVIKQGEDGDNLYVVDSGELECFKRFTQNGEEKFLKTYFPGESFGELSLLYNAPRAATIKAKTDATLFSLDRDCFNHIVKDAAVKKRLKYEEFLAKIEILDQMDAYERAQLCDALKNRSFTANEYIIKQGDEGDDFFIVEEGNLVCVRDEGNGNGPVEVLQYSAGDYFGELALIRNIPRQASVISKSEGKLVLLDRLTFKRLLGPLEEIMKRNILKYQQFRKNNEV